MEKDTAGCRALTKYIVTGVIVTTMLKEIGLFYQNTDDSVLDICHYIDNTYSVSSGTGLTLFKHLVANKHLPFDMDRRPELTERREGQPELYAIGRQVSI